MLKQPKLVIKEVSLAWTFIKCKDNQSFVKITIFASKFIKNNPYYESRRFL